MPGRSIPSAGYFVLDELLHLLWYDLTKQTSAPCYCPKEQPMPNIRAITQNKKQYLPLLLLADEQEDMIDRYLDRQP